MISKYKQSDCSPVSGNAESASPRSGEVRQTLILREGGAGNKTILCLDEQQVSGKGSHRLGQHSMEC